MIRFSTSIAFAFGFLFLIPSTLGQVLPFFTRTAQTVGFESNAFRTYSRILARNRLESDGEAVPDPEDRELFVFSQVFAVPVRIDGNTVLTVVAPVLRKELGLNRPGGLRDELSNGGMGDMTVTLKRRFYRNDSLEGGIQAAFIAGVKLPTGAHQDRDSEGNLLPSGLQLGSGSVDVPLGVTFTAFRDRIGFTSDFIYRLNNEADSFRFGDSANIDLALGYRLFPGSYKSFHDKVLNVYLEFNTLLSQGASLNGQEVLDSGGTVAFVSPGVQAVLTPRFLIEAALQIPVLQNLNGSQLAFSATASFGIRLLF